MFSIEENRRAWAGGWRLTATQRAVAGPVAVVVLVLALLVGTRLASYHGDPAGFIVFGHQYEQYTHPPAGAPANSPIGYDGQFYWIEARDPLLLHRSTFSDMTGPGAGYHFQRPAYPALAFLLALGQIAALPWTMLLVNLLAVVGITAAFAFYCHRRGWSSWWALVIGLMPGLLMPTLRDLTDTLALATALAGLLAWYSQRRWWAAGLLTVAVLSREPMLVVPVAIAAEAAISLWGSRPRRARLGAIVARAWPPVVLPVAAFGAWQAYIHLHSPVIAGAAKAGATSPLLLPSFSGLADRVRLLLSGTPPLIATWEVVYLVLVVAAALTALLLVRRGRAAGIGALLFAGTLVLIQFGDQWGLTRYTAPLFAMLLLVGLERQSRLAKTICVAATGMSLFLPWLIVGL